MPRWGGLLGLALVGCLETPDIELVDPDQRVADAQGPDGADQAATPVDGGPDAMRPDAAPGGDKGVDGGGCVPQAERCDGLDDDCDG
ncbi:MAG: hypothetical protein KC613_15650, partial [Myxococcales bacterium]|nr:hypothetical protein [Myxococcales bacterium]